MKPYRLLQMVAICLAAFLYQSCWDTSKYDPQPYVRPLEIIKLSDQNYLHVSYLKNDKGGYIPCNGFIKIDNGRAFVFDTPLNDSISRQLIDYITEDLKATIDGVLVSHHHQDAAGGVQAFNTANIPSYGSSKTAALLAQDSIYLSNTFEVSDSISLGNNLIVLRYFGPGHTDDNSFGYITNDHILYGGCLIKPVDGTKGNIADADLKEWPLTVSKIKAAYPEVQLIIPGHGKRGGENLLDYTIELFSTDTLSADLNKPDLTQ